jgi:phospholipase C
MAGWQREGNFTCTASTGYRCLSGYQAPQEPNIIALATKYAINDRFFESMDSPSWGGHLYAVAGTLDGFTGDNPVTSGGPGWGCDSHKLAAWAAGGLQPSCVPDFALNPVQYPNGGAFEPTKALYVPTIMDRLDAAGLTWKIYGPASPSDGGYDWAVCPSFAECLDTGQRANLVDESQFFTDATAGTLPAFSLITAGGATIGARDSCHNGFSMTACDNYVGEVAKAVMSSPEWSSTALIITWDDFGGFYDSQPPPGTNPDGTQQGIRLPFIVVSPYAKPAFTDSTPATFASVLAFTEQNFGLPSLGENDATAYPLSNLFNLSATPARTVKPRMVTRPVPKGDHIQWWEANQGT